MAELPTEHESSFRERPLLALFPPAGGSAARTAIHAQPQPAPARDHEHVYGLTESPFSPHADLRFLYPSAEHERVARELLASVQRRDGLVVLTGAPGTGKTLMSRALAGRLDRRTLTAIIADPVQTLEELVSMILASFGVISSVALWRAREQGRREKLYAALHEFLQSLEPLQAFAVLWIDDVERFPVPLMQELIALVGTHVQARRLQLVLAGGAQIDQLIAEIDTADLVGGVSTRLTLGALAADEVTPYVLHRLDVAGSSRHVSFDDAVSPRLFVHTGGIPGAINTLCTRALEIGYAEGVAEIDAAVVEQAAESLGLPTAGRARWADALLLLLVIVVSTAAGGSVAALLLRHRVAQLLMHP